MIDKQTVCFTGHRELPLGNIDLIRGTLESVVRDLILKGHTRFAAGGAKGFDMLAEKLVLKLKREFPQISLELVLPYPKQAHGWDLASFNEYEEIKRSADRYSYIANEYNKKCLLERNRALVDMSSICVCYLTQKTGGTAYTVRYAKACGLELINIADAALKNTQTTFSLI